MTELQGYYLILHKVRDAPAFDIAEPMEIGGEQGWIIPTSGHRAYPIAHWEFAKALELGWTDHLLGEEWKALQDHYSTKAEPKRPVLGKLLAGLGLGPKLPQVRRLG
jgi:hypothetical protein